MDPSLAPSTAAFRLPEVVARLDRVGKRFGDGVPVLDDLSLTLRAGEFVSLVGPSGCGKSTVLRLVSGLETADAGEVTTPDGLGYVFQEPTLMPWASALDNVALPLRFARVAKAVARERAAAALGRVGLAQAAAKTPRELSGGMRMRVAIARALVTGPRVLLMDEPFAALDEIGRFALEDELLDLQAREGFSVLFVTHSVYEAVHLSDRVVIMAAAPGRIAAERVIERGGPKGAAFRATAAFAETAAAVSADLAGAMGRR